ncbi:hypothetical protein CEF21_17425 [Bacillus sp. FJAT-42376]|nr:hypothetical protein CEF21_17425 [Bacillus sp. FJAT-42376]
MTPPCVFILYKIKTRPNLTCMTIMFSCTLAPAAGSYSMHLVSGTGTKWGHLCDSEAAIFYTTSSII